MAFDRFILGVNLYDQVLIHSISLKKYTKYSYLINLMYLINQFGLNLT